ncbi:hypothetical protein [Cupriavidus basilensis]|nr:hypothetical protein [Cupriavidus basilensis]MDF3884504.1 hypothetical protein [Cupriavidus basilensis]
MLTALALALALALQTVAILLALSSMVSPGWCSRASCQGIAAGVAACSAR